jgi:ABC-2 type transport system permease protein
MNLSLLTVQLKREIWENKVRFIYAPIVASAIFVTLVSYDIFKFGFSNAFHSGEGAQFILGNLGYITAYSININTLVLLALSVFLLIAYAHGSLFDDRKSKDILFWRSLPVSETTNVLMKLAVIYGVLPLIVLALNLCIGLLTLVSEIYVHHNTGYSFATVFSSIHVNHLLLVIWKMFSLHLLLLLLIFPAIGFMLLMSAWAKRSPLLLSSTIPVVLLLVDKGAQVWLGINLKLIDALNTCKTLFDIILANAFELERYGHNSLLTNADFILPLMVCVGVGAVCICGAIWLRNNRYEI